MPPADKPTIRIERTPSQKAADAATRQKALALFEEGVGYVRVASFLGLSKYTVRDWYHLFKRGKFKAALSDNQLLYSEQTKKEALQLRASGMSWPEFERRTGISRGTCQHWIRQAKLKNVEPFDNLDSIGR